MTVSLARDRGPASCSPSRWPTFCSAVTSGNAGASPAHGGGRAARRWRSRCPFAALSDTLLGASRGYRDMRPTVVIDKIGRVQRQLIGVAIAVSAGSVALLAPLWALPYVPAAAVGWYWLRRIRRSQRPGRAGRGPSAGRPA